MNWGESIQSFIDGLTPEGVQLAVVSFAFPTILFLFRLRSAWKRLAIQQKEIRYLERLTVGVDAEQQTTALQTQKVMAEGHLREREEQLEKIDEEINEWEKKKTKNPDIIKSKKDETKALQRLTGAMQKEWEAAPNKIVELRTARQELHQKVQGTRGFLKRVDYEIQEVAKGVLGKTS